MPGDESFQSANVRIPIRRWISGTTRCNFFPPVAARGPRKSRPMVAALIASIFLPGSLPPGVNAVPLQVRQEDPQQRFQSLAADPIRRLPEHDERCANRLVVEPRASALPLSLWLPRLIAIEHTKRMFWMIAADCDKFGEDLLLFVFGRGPGNGSELPAPTLVAPAG